MRASARASTRPRRAPSRAMRPPRSGGAARVAAREGREGRRSRCDLDERRCRHPIRSPTVTAAATAIPDCSELERPVGERERGSRQRLGDERQPPRRRGRATVAGVPASGTKIGFVSRPIGVTRLKWSATSGAVPSERCRGNQQRERRRRRSRAAASAVHGRPRTLGHELRGENQRQHRRERELERNVERGAGHIDRQRRRGQARERAAGSTSRATARLATKSAGHRHRACRGHAEPRERRVERRRERAPRAPRAPARGRGAAATRCEKESSRRSRRRCPRRARCEAPTPKADVPGRRPSRAFQRSAGTAASSPTTSARSKRRVPRRQRGVDQPADSLSFGRERRAPRSC